VRIDQANGSEVVERILEAYGFTMQKELAEHLGIAKSNVAGWVLRGQVPGNAILQCALDTGADVSWLVSGEFANASKDTSAIQTVGKELHNLILANGGKKVVSRILKAYGFTTQKQLCEHLNISSGTVSTWVRRDYFPGDVVLTCALETGASLAWLATGKKMIDSCFSSDPQQNKIPVKKLVGGELKDEGEWYVDIGLISDNPTDPIYVRSIKKAWVVDLALDEISNGNWLLKLDGKLDIYQVFLLSSRKVKLINRGVDFICSTKDFEVSGKVITTFEFE